LINDLEFKVSLLQHAFVSNYSVDNSHLLSSGKRVSDNLSRIYFSAAFVRRNLMLKRKVVLIALCYPLSLPFTLSFEHSIVPDAWLQSFITVIFKKGNPCDPTNYCPISLTAIICKLIETTIKDQLVQCLVNKGLIDKHRKCCIS
jgi:hypothetical protein